MKYYNNWFVFSCALILVGCMQKKDLVIKPLDPFSKSYIIGKNRVQHLYYFVDGFADSSDLIQLSKFAEGIVQGDSVKSDIVTCYFYQRSSKIGEQFHEREDDLVEWHKEDLLLSFEWQKGKTSFVSYVVLDPGFPYH